MDPRKKRIYIAIIVVCLVLSAGILFWSQTDFSSIGPAPQPGSVAIPINEASGDVSNGFTPPSVFPVTKEFRTEVLESTAFTDLKTFIPVDVTGQLGRPDPFKNY
jgi:hypothetical protein